MSNKKEKDWHSKRLQDMIKDNITKFFETVLDFSEVAVGDEKRYKALRSKILRHGNDTIRKINSDLAINYDVQYKNIGHDVVKVMNRKGDADNE